ncbi:MAG: endonuclease/exonuclease/phosphatase family protein [Rhodobacteraceae bacterium]|nr:endonuclease/exonuclease/phosphatase family protein [Paracoccaceae bacterium]
MRPIALALVAMLIAGHCVPQAAASAPAPLPEAGTIRLAVFHGAFSRRRPGELVRELERGSPALEASLAALVAIAPDVVLLSRIDWDARSIALSLLQERLAEAGHAMPHVFHARPNSGLPAGRDLVGGGRPGVARDVQGYGRFSGHGGMALLSRLPLEAERAADYTALRWADLPDARLPHLDGAPFPSSEALAVQRLSSVGLWDVPARLPGGGVLRLLAGVSTPPLPDGPAGRNALRNADEARFWLAYLDGWAPPGGLPPAAGEPLALLAHLNADPDRGLGQTAAIRALLAHPRLQDPFAHPAEAATALIGEEGLRLSYVLPDATLAVVAAGLLWPDIDEGERAGRNAVVWVDIRLPPVP